MTDQQHHPPTLASVLPYLILPPLFWAGNVTVGRAVRDDIAPIALSFGRWVIALVILLPFTLRVIHREWPLYRQHWSKIIAVSIVGVAAFNTLVYKGLHSTTTTNAILLNSCIPALIMIFGVLFYRQKLHPTQILGLLLSLTGVLCIVLNGEPARLLHLTINPGDITIFLAMVCWALYTLWMKNIPTTINRLGLTGVQIFIAILVLTPLFLWETAHAAAPLALNTRALLGLTYVGIFPSVIAYILYTMAVQKVGALHAGLSIHLMPVFGVFLSVFVLGEAIHAYHILGIALIVGGLLLSNRSQPPVRAGHNPQPSTR